LHLYNESGRANWLTYKFTSIDFISFCYSQQDSLKNNSIIILVSNWLSPILLCLHGVTFPFHWGYMLLYLYMAIEPVGRKCRVESNASLRLLSFSSCLSSIPCRCGDIITFGQSSSSRLLPSYKTVLTCLLQFRFDSFCSLIRFRMKTAVQRESA
jgi:hypothetical protein